MNAAATDPPPTVSVVIPMRNGEPYIDDTLSSVLGQAGVDLEVVVVDDGSTDGSGQRLRSRNEPRLRVVDGPCRGIAASLNAGFAAASGRYVVRCDADDRLTPGRLAAQAASLDERPDFVAVCGSFHTTTARGRRLAAMRSGDQAVEITDELRRGETRTHFGTFMTRADALARVGGARPYFEVAEDIDLQLRLATAGRVWYEPRDVYAYRLHDASSTHTQARPEIDFLTETARRFARQRAESGTDDLERGDPPAVPRGGGPASDAGRHTQGILLGEAWRAHQGGDRVAALRLGLRSAARSPLRPAAWKGVALMLLKPVGRPNDGPGGPDGTI
ncbi:MAG: glycosyltransferase family A protein [Planctomycetota bacterium]